MADGWTTVEKKVKPVYVVRPDPCQQGEVESIVKRYFEEVPYVKSIALYGSVNHISSFSETSDVDVMIFISTVKRLPFSDWKDQLQALLRRKVDLVVMRITGKVQDPEYRDKVFYDQVYETGRTIYGDDFKDYLDRSRKIGKY